MEKTYNVNGMSCSVCAAHVEKAALAVKGVKSAEVNLVSNTVKLSWDDSVCREGDIAKAVKKAGYELVVEKKSDSLYGQRAGLFASVLLLLPIMYFSMAHMLSLPLPKALAHGSVANALIQFGLCVPVIVINFRFFKRGMPRLFKGQPNMDTLIAVGGGSAFLYSIFSLIMLIIEHDSKHSIYFETAAMILTLVSVGKYLEARAKSRTGVALDKLNSLVPAVAELFENGNIRTVSADSLKAEDVILIREGVVIPADGEVIYGAGIVDESGLTGESVPVDKECGDSVKAGTVNTGGVFRMRVISAGKDTVISKMIALVQDASATKAPIARLADRVSAVFVPVVMSIALVTAIVWFFISHDFETALKMGVTVLVVSCPCSLGLATPVAVTAAIYKSAEKGILVKSAEVFELLEKTDTVVLDKTGTVTQGKPSLYGVRSYSEDFSESDIVKISVSLEAASNHPFAEAFLSEAEKLGIEAVPASEYENVPGRGISGVTDNQKYFIGNLKFATEILAEGLPERVVEEVEREAGEGKTPLLLFNSERLLGASFVADTVKSEAAFAVSELKKRGKRVFMLTGDNERTAAAIAGLAGIDEFKAGVLPDEKEASIREVITAGGKPIMVGDGINDSAALASAAVGVAMGSGTDIAIESADCVLLKNSLYDVVSLIDISHFALRIMKQNLFWALFYNCLCIPAAAGVFIPLGISFSPMLASAAMSLSSLIVVTNALRIMRLK